MQREGLGGPEAIASIERVDKERREWTRFLFGVDWDDAYLYDMVLNLSRMSLQTGCDMVVRMTEREEFRPTAASLRAMQDLTLEGRVAAALAVDYRTRDAELKVAARDGVVTISGETRWPEVVDALPTVIGQIEGLKELRTNITGVSPPADLRWY